MARRSVDLVVQLVGDNKLKPGLDAASKDVDGFGAKLGKLGKTAAIGFAAVGTAVATVGVGLFKVGESFDAEFDKIRVGTGATGQVLEGLEGSFKKVLTSVPTDFDSAGTAIADLNTRLGLTGAPLEHLSGQFINLARITKTDVAPNIDAITRVFGDWGITADDMPERMDQIFRASQASGIGIDQLSQSVVQFGAPLRNLGFGLDESLALLAQFNKTGVNTEGVMAGLKIGVGTLAKAGEDVPTTFRRIVDEITNMGPGTEATGLAIKLFGQRVGPDLADAIAAGGKFEIDGMLDAIANGEDTINGAAKDTEDFGEKWQLLKNRVLVGLEPLASKVFDGVGQAMDRLGPTITRLQAWFETRLQPTLERFGTWVAANVPPVLAAVADFITTRIVPALQSLAGWIETNLLPALAKLTASFEENILPTLEKVAGFVKDVVIPILAQIGEWIVKYVLPAIGELAVFFLGTAIPAMFEVHGFIADKLIPVFEAVGRFIRDKVIPAVQDLVGWFGSVGTKAGEIAGTVKGAFDGLVTFFAELPTRIKSAAGDLFGFVWDTFRSAINKVIGGWNTLRDKLQVSVHLDIPFAPDVDFDSGPILPSITPLARGTRSFAGGLALVGEEGPELVALPRGAAVTPARQTAALLAGGAAGGGVGTVNIYAQSGDPGAIRRELEWFMSAVNRQAV